MTRPAEYIASACEGKHPFRSPQQARRIAAKRPGVEHYRCPCCGLWHIGTPPRRKRAN